MTHTTTQPTPSILLVDDMPRDLEDYGNALAKRWTVHKAATVDDAEFCLRHHNLTLLITDLEIDHTWRTGLDLIELTYHLSPSTLVLIISQEDSDDVLMKLPAYPNIRGFLAKRSFSMVIEVVTATSTILNNATFFSPGILRRMNKLQQLFSISENNDDSPEAIPSEFGPRQQEVFDLIGRDGCTNREISRILNLKGERVERIVSALLRKCDCKNRHELRVKWWKENNQFK